jgi:hypothetical protein
MSPRTYLELCLKQAHENPVDGAKLQPGPFKKRSYPERCPYTVSGLRLNTIYQSFQLSLPVTYIV